MAFSLTAYYSLAGVTSLSDGNPFGLESAEGLSGADIVRFGQRSPQQSGITDLGYRLQPRTFTLTLLFTASTPSALDTYRQTLMTIFRPFWSVRLRAVRDDNTARNLTCYAVDDIAISLVPEHKPGNLHRATVKLRAPNPLWHDDSVTSVFTYVTEWWAAGGYIDTDQVREYVESVTGAGNTDGWTANYTITDDWAVATKTSPHTGGSVHYAWDTAGATGPRLYYTSSTGLYAYNNASGTTWPGGTAANYHVITNESAVSYWKYWNGTAVATHGSVAGDLSLTYSGRWRGEELGSTGKWTPDLGRSMIWHTPTATQIRALAPFVLGSVTYGVIGLNAGDVPVFPYIQLTGPLEDPVLTNQQTGGTINLTGLTLGTTDTCVIDLRTGDKRITDINGSNLLGSVTTLPISIADFYLAPAPEAPEGYNVIEVTAGSIGTAATITLQHTNRYLSF